MLIRFFASVRNITEVKEVEWGEPAPTLGDLLRLLSDRYGPEFRRWVLDGESLGNSVLVVINGNDARHQGGLATRLAATDVVSILPIMAGGAPKQSAISDQRSGASDQPSAISVQPKRATRKRPLIRGPRRLDPLSGVPFLLHADR